MRKLIIKIGLPCLQQKIDVREEAADQTAIRIFSILRVLKYKPPTDSNNLWVSITSGQFPHVLGPMYLIHNQRE